MKSQVNQNICISGLNPVGSCEKHCRAYLHYMEDADPDLRMHTGYMKKMHKHVVKVIEALENCGYEKLLSLAHGDAKPNNFMFRSCHAELLSFLGISHIMLYMYFIINVHSVALAHSQGCRGKNGGCCAKGLGEVLGELQGLFTFKSLVADHPHFF